MIVWGRNYKLIDKLTNTSSRNITRIESPPILTDTIGLVAIRFTISVVATFNIFAGCFALHHRGCPHVTTLAFAMITAQWIEAFWVRSAWIGTVLAFVNVHANWSFRKETFLAETLIFYAFCVVSAVKVGFAEYVYINLRIDWECVCCSKSLFV